MPQIAVLGNMEGGCQQLVVDRNFLKFLSQAQSQFILDANITNFFNCLLTNILELTQSDYALIVEVQGDAQLKVRGKAYFSDRVLTNIADQKAERSCDRQNELKAIIDSYELKKLFSSISITGEPVIANDLAIARQGRNSPKERPLLNSCLGLPLFDGDRQLNGLVLIANRSGGYNESLIADLEPFATACGNAIAANRNQKRKQQAEEKLREGEELYRTIFEQAAVGIARVTVDGRFLEVNQKFSDLLGYSREEMRSLGRHVTHPDDLNVNRESMRQLLAGEISSYALEKRFIRNDGSLIWVQITTSLVRHLSGEPSYLIKVVEDISDRKRAELALQEREQFLASIYDSVEHPIFVVDVLENNDFRYAGVNPAGLSVTNTCIEQVAGKSPEQVFPEAIAASMRQCYTDCLKAGTSIYYEERIILLGEENWWNITLTPVRNEEGRINQLIGMTLNITDRKQAESALQESQLFIEKIAKASPSLLYLYDMIEQRNIYVNREMTATLGYTPEEVQKMGTAVLSNLLHPEDLVKLLGHYKQFDTAKDGEIFEIEYRMKHKDGAWRWLVSRESVFSRTVDGKPKLRIGTATDITARKLAEEALQKSEAQFRKLAEREALINRLAQQIRNSLDINTILETTVQEIRSLLQLDSCLFIWYLPKGKDSDSKLPAWHVVHEAKNSDLPALLGYYLTDTTIKCQAAIAKLEIIRIDDIAALTNPIKRQFFLTLGYKSLLNVPLQTSSGAVGAIACGACTELRVWKDDEVELLQAISVQLAIAISQAELYTQTQNSARIAQEKAKQLEVILQNLQQTQAQLIQSEKMSSLGQMVAGIAHEINNPTSFIYSNIQPATAYISDLFNLLALYQKQYPYPAAEIKKQIEAIELDFLVKDLSKLLNSMQVGATRIRDIVRSLRTFSRLDESAMKHVDIHEGIDSTLMILEHRLKKVGGFSGIQVIKNYGKLPLVECYPGQLNQVFMNILVNSIDALEEAIDKATCSCQFPTIQIRTSVVNANQVLIKIADNGLGMTEAVQRRLFDPFFTTKPVGSGTGLGMSISYQIIEKHGGKLQCISAPGNGAEFSILLPIKF